MASLHVGTIASQGAVSYGRDCTFHFGKEIMFAEPRMGSWDPTAAAYFVSYSPCCGRFSPPPPLEKVRLHADVPKGDNCRLLLFLHKSAVFVPAYSQWGKWVGHPSKSQQDGRIKGTGSAGRVQGYIVGMSCKRARVVTACDCCRVKKTKCNGQTPCQKCIANGTVCVYSERVKKERVFTNEEVRLIENKVDILTGALLKMTALVRNNDSRALEALSKSLSAGDLQINNVIRAVGAVGDHSAVQPKEAMQTMELMGAGIPSGGRPPVSSVARVSSGSFSLHTPASTPTRTLSWASEISPEFFIGDPFCGGEHGDPDAGSTLGHMGPPMGLGVSVGATIPTDASMAKLFDEMDYFTSDVRDVNLPLTIDPRSQIPRSEYSVLS